MDFTSRLSLNAFFGIAVSGFVVGLPVGLYHLNAPSSCDIAILFGMWEFFCSTSGPFLWPVAYVFTLIDGFYFLGADPWIVTAVKIGGPFIFAILLTIIEANICKMDNRNEFTPSFLEELSNDLFG